MQDKNKLKNNRRKNLMDRNTLEEIMIELSDNIPHDKIVIKSGKILGTGEILETNAVNITDDYIYRINSFPKSKEDAERILDEIITSIGKFDLYDYDVDFKIELFLKHREL